MSIRGCEGCKARSASSFASAWPRRSSMIGSSAAVGSGPWRSTAWKYGSRRVRRMVVNDHAHYITYGALWVTELSCDSACARGLRRGRFRRSGECSSTIRIRPSRLYDGHRHLRGTLTGRGPLLGCLCVSRCFRRRRGFPSLPLDWTVVYFILFHRSHPDGFRNFDTWPI